MIIVLRAMDWSAVIKPKPDSTLGALLGGRLALEGNWGLSGKQRLTTELEYHDFW